MNRSPDLGCTLSYWQLPSVCVPGASQNVVPAGFALTKLGRLCLVDTRTACFGGVEGPRLGTRAESLFLPSAGADLVGMTNVPQAFLALEAQIGYCTIALATDYDCWLDDPAQHVSANQVLALFQANLARVQQLLGECIAEYQEDESRPCRRALREALVTRRENMTQQQRTLVEMLSR